MFTENILELRPTDKSAAPQYQYKIYRKKAFLWLLDLYFHGELQRSLIYQNLIDTRQDSRKNRGM